MCKVWIRLKNTVEAAVTDLRACLKTLRVPFNLIDTIETLEWIVRTEPTTLDAHNAAIVTVNDCLVNLDNFSKIADDDNKIELRDRINSNHRSIYPPLMGYMG